MNEDQNKYYRMFVTTQTTLDEYRPLIGTPKQRQAAINAAKKTLDTHIKNANDTLTDVLDKLMLRYQVTHPAFHAA